MEKELTDKNTNEAMLIFNQKLHSAYNKSFPFKRLSRIHIQSNRRKQIYLQII